MRLAHSLVKLPGIACAALLTVLSGLSAWGLMSVFTSPAKAFVTQAVELYDSAFPEITISKGKASVRGTQPYIKEFAEEKGERSQSVIIVIDTREGKQNEAMSHLKGVSEGIALTRDALAVKNNRQTRMLPLRDLPDFVLNSRTLKELSDAHLDTVVSLIAMVVLGYFLVAKLIQAMLLALIAWLGARANGAPCDYGKAMKLAVPALAPAVLVDVGVNLLGVHVPAFFVLYFALCMGLVVLLTRDLAGPPVDAIPSDARKPL